MRGEARLCCVFALYSAVFSLQHCEKLLFNLDEMGNVNFLLDEMGLDKMGVDEMGRHLKGHS